MSDHESDNGTLAGRLHADKPDVQILREALDYNPLTGVFVWRARPFSHFNSRRGMNASNTRFSGKIAGCSRGRVLNEYWTFRLQDVLVYAHRAAWAYVHGEWPPLQIDHINGDKSDNRLVNLRLAAHHENLRNARLSRRNTSGVKGVIWVKDKQKWGVRLRYQNRYHHIGYFDALEEAAQAVRVAREKHHGEFANHG